MNIPEDVLRQRVWKKYGANYLNTTEGRTLELLYSTDKPLNAREVAELLNVKFNTSNKDLRTLAQDGFIQSGGSMPTVYWVEN
jgi:DNA-binding MarR family transcriptional regulator